MIAYPHTQHRPTLTGTSSDDCIEYLKLGYWYLKTVRGIADRQKKLHDEYLTGLCELIIFFDKLKGCLDSDFTINNSRFTFAGRFSAGASGASLGSIHAGRAILAYYRHLVATRQIIPYPQPNEPKDDYQRQMAGAKDYLRETSKAGRRARWFESERNKFIIDVYRAMAPERNYSQQIINWMESAGWESGDIPPQETIRKIVTSTKRKFTSVTIVDK